MGSELDAMRFDLPDLRQAEHLEAAAIGEDGPGPVDESMQPAGLGDNVQAGPDIEMISVAEDDLRAHLLQFAWIEGLDAALGSHRHEDGRVDHPARRGQPAQSRARGGIGLEQFKHGPRLSHEALAMERESWCPFFSCWPPCGH